ncbi:HEPN domain-containing protein [Sphingobacterium oryzagri]|uniref:HEPN domain-containing protein n=1 Tax=Sphingobacterium oryzagri TaxID=3025669 RepID=A0ABY7WM02_9SPHI|nr:HEPN domain-containing protein [Sphingobacterium sp. KACC 22765]WDF69594.1 HEPN domain-containing protein [Sphingobacterium sp. KACC 22765]
MEIKICDVNREASAIAERLVASLLIEQIYVIEDQNKGAPAHELIILLPSTNTQHITEARAMIGTLISCEGNFRYRTFYFHEVKEGIKRGSIVFFSICQPRQLIYIRPESNVRLYNDKVTFEKVYKRAKLQSRREHKKIGSFRQGMQFYYDRGNDALCALMLHQVFELCYRLAEINLIGKEKISHSLRGHHRFLIDYLPELSTIFDIGDEREMTLLENLNEAYIRARYENSYQISRSAINELIDRSVQLEKIIEDYSVVLHGQFEDRFASEDFPSESETNPTVLHSNSKSSGPNYAGKDLNFKQQVVAKITDSVDTHSIYQIGRSCNTDMVSKTLLGGGGGGQNYCCYLLVVTKEDFAGSIYGLQNDLNYSNEGGERVVLLFHTKKAVEKSIREGELFFIRQLAKADVLFKEQEGNVLFKELPLPEISSSYPSGKNSKWIKRLHKITVLNREIHKMVEDSVLRLCLYSLLTEQLCLAYIDVFLDYRPNHNSLPHLLSVCSLIDRKVYNFFPNNSEQDHTLLKMLSGSISNFRFRLSCEVNGGDINIIGERITRFTDYVISENGSYFEKNQIVPS